ncbi:MAG TPA: DNA gyrase inhibitor YacG [Hydrogenophaga sp.]
MPPQPEKKKQQEKWVSCPQCGNESAYSCQNAFRPFCSVRCKGLDLGAWASEQFALAEHLPKSGAEFERH